MRIKGPRFNISGSDRGVLIFDLPVRYRPKRSIFPTKGGAVPNELQKKMFREMEQKAIFRQAPECAFD